MMTGRAEELIAIEHETPLCRDEANDAAEIPCHVLCGHVGFAPVEATSSAVSLRRDTRPHALQARALEPITRFFWEKQNLLGPQQRMLLQTLFCTAAVAYCYLFRFATAWL